jgi:hypothetical protein
MAGNYLSNPNPQYSDLNGNPLASGTVEFWEAGGTTTPLDTFTDSALTVANPNPIPLNADGRAPDPVFLQQLSYNVVLKNSGGSVEWSRDNVSNILQVSVTGTAAVDTYAALTSLLKATLLDGTIRQVNGRTTLGDMEPGIFKWDAASSATANGGTILISDEGGTGRWLRVYDGPINVVWFGAVGDDATDNTVALQAAIDTALSTTVNDAAGIFIPRGIYRSGALSIVIGAATRPGGPMITGEGSQASVLKPTALVTTFIEINNTSQFLITSHWDNFGIDMSLQADVATSIGLLLNKSFDNSFDSIKIEPPGSLARAVKCIGNTFTTQFSDCEFGSLTGVVELAGDPTTFVTTIKFNNCSMGQLNLSRAEHITCDHTTFQGNLDKIVIGDDCLHIRNINGDVEGLGTYLNITGAGGNVRAIDSIGNAFVGFSGTYIAGEANINQDNTSLLLDYGQGSDTKIITRFRHFFESDFGPEITARDTGRGMVVNNSSTGNTTVRLDLQNEGVAAVQLAGFNDPSLNSLTVLDMNMIGGDMTLSFSATERHRFITDGGVKFPNLPTSTVGRATGELWNDGGTVKVVP